MLLPSLITLVEDLYQSIDHLESPAPEYVTRRLLLTQAEGSPDAVRNRRTRSSGSQV